SPWPCSTGSRPGTTPAADTATAAGSAPSTTKPPPLREPPHPTGPSERGISKRVQQVRDGRLVQSHRRVLLRVHLGRYTQGSRRWLTSRWTRTPPRQGTHAPSAGSFPALLLLPWVMRP